MSDSDTVGRGPLGSWLHSLQAPLHVVFLLLIFALHPFVVKSLAYEQQKRNRTHKFSRPLHLTLEFGKWKPLLFDQIFQMILTQA